MNQQIFMYPIYNLHYYDNNVKAYTTRRKKNDRPIPEWSSNLMIDIA